MESEAEAFSFKIQMLIKARAFIDLTYRFSIIACWRLARCRSYRYLYSNEDYVKSGALLAIGLVNCGVRNECDPALALLSEYVSSNTQTLRIGAVLGLGLAYAGSRRKDVTQILSAALADEQSNTVVVLQSVGKIKNKNY